MRLLCFIASVLLALLSVACAKGNDDQIRVYAFSSDFCTGSPAGGNIDVKRDECKDLEDGARSIKPMIDTKRDKWVNDINNGAMFCHLITFHSPGCLDEHEVKIFPLPERLHDCLRMEIPGASQAIGSVKFACGTFEVPATTNVTTTIVMHATSWSFGSDEIPTPYVVTDTLTQTRVDKSKNAARSAEPSENRLEPRGTQKGSSKGVWMFHPWSRSVICYECYTEKADDFTQFECRSGPNNPIDCGEQPPAIEGQHTTVTHTASITVTATGIETTTSYVMTTSTLDRQDIENVQSISLAKRSWHRRVTFDHPFKQGTVVCADAEWEKRGQAAAEIRLQKPGTNLMQCQDEEAQAIDLPYVEHKTLLHATTTTRIAEAKATHTIFIYSPEVEDPRVVYFTAHNDL